jgi:hypothetical protein
MDNDPSADTGEYAGTDLDMPPLPEPHSPIEPVRIDCIAPR